jgi:signal transduction histidine kinase/ligand-binding sensor domain-containing protein
MEPCHLVINARIEQARSHHRLLASVILLLWNVTFCFGQKEVRIERITIDQGLSQSSVSAILQDRYGYLWVATLDGLNRYDGREFKIYRHTNNDPNSLYRNHVSKLYLDHLKNLWIIYHGVIGRYNPGEDNFTNFPILLDGEPAPDMIAHDFDYLSDSLALLSTNQGVIEFNMFTGVSKRSDRHKEFNGQNVLSIFDVESIGNWVITNTAVWIKANHSDTYAAAYKDDIGLRCLFDKASGSIYLQTKSRLLKYNPADKDFYLLDTFNPAEDFDKNNFGMQKLSNGELWLFRRGIYVYDANDRHITTLKNIPQNPTSLSGNYLTCLFESEDKVVWIGTNGFGLNKYDPTLSVFKYIGNFDGTPITLSDNFVYAVLTDDDTHLFVGTLAGLDVLDLKNNTSYFYLLKGKDNLAARPTKIFKDAKGIIWLCTNKGLMFFDGNTVRPSGLSVLDREAINVHDVVKTGRDQYALSTEDGIYSFQPGKRRCTKISSSGSLIIGLMNGQLWIETNLEIRHLNPETGELLYVIKKNSADKSGFPNVPVKCFYEDSQGSQWVGSWGGGLSLYDPGKGTFQHFDENNSGLPNSVVYGILEDRKGNLWLSTNKGISIFNIALKKSVRNFYKEDGLQGNEFNTKAYHQSPSGRFYFGGTNGLTFFDTEEAIKIRPGIPKTILTGFFINNVRADRIVNSNASNPSGSQDIILNSAERNFSFEIEGLGFTSPGRIQFKYILENFNNTWVNIGNQRMISFTNMPPGKYTFRAKSANSFGEWEESELKVNIIVEGPFWKAAWFRWAAFFFILALGYLFYYQRTVRLRARSKYLESVVRQRTREIQIMNEEIAAQNEELTAQSETLYLRNNELSVTKASLQQKVEERTMELQKLNQELVQQNSQLEQFAFITAHNIRGPVARIKGLIQLLSTKDTEEVAHLNLSVNNLDDVISDLSIILNVRHGTDKLFEPSNLKELIMQAVHGLDTEIKKKDAQIDLDSFDAITISGIKPYLYSIFHNLLHNAIKYSDPVRKLQITASCKKTDNHTVQIIIADNGLGVDMRYAEEKIFNLYQRFHPNIKGKGFGLFLVKTQVEAMNGRISVKSAVNVGTTFTIEFAQS